VSLHEQIEFLNQLASLMKSFDAEIFVNDENELRIDLRASIEEPLPDERGDAIFFNRGSVTAELIRKRLDC